MSLSLYNKGGKIKGGSGVTAGGNMLEQTQY
jgi:hypothetical protein